jgi:hypothetical protein
MNKSMRKSVVFLGEDFLSANNIDHKIHAALVNKCLDFLRENYGKECELIYKPHPRWNKELEVLDLTAFKIYKDHDPAELYFIKNSKNIKAVFSVISTASRSAINCCLPSYMFYKTFPFAKSVLKEWGNLLGKMPSESFITNLDKKPGQIKVKDWSKSHQVFSDHLVFAIKDLIGKI